jgi:hypothetical protein
VPGDHRLGTKRAIVACQRDRVHSGGRRTP